MSRRRGRRGDPNLSRAAALLDLRDHLAVALHTVACLHMACSHLSRGSERSALATVSNAVREQLEDLADALGRMSDR